MNACGRRGVSRGPAGSSRSRIGKRPRASDRRIDAASPTAALQWHIEKATHALRRTALIAREEGLSI